jgi:2-phospho-L-lactate guanylyltransferase
MALRAGDAAIARNRDRASVNIAVLQPDLGALKPHELRDATDLARKVRRSFVPDQEGTGTSALFAFGVDLDPKFGDGSARRHHLSGASRLDGSWPGLTRDVDTTTDPKAAWRLGLNRETGAALEQRRGVRPYCTEV